jgi:hypothetical protein
VQIGNQIITINTKILLTIGALFASVIMLGATGSVGATLHHYGSQFNNHNQQNNHCTWRYSDYHGSHMHMR